MDRESDGPAGIKERNSATDLNYRINALKYIFKLTLTKEKHKKFKINISESSTKILLTLFL